MRKQKLAIKRVYEDKDKYFESIGFKPRWFHYIIGLPKEIREYLNGMRYRMWYINNYPEYIDNSGKFLNEVEVDFNLDRDMGKYGWTQEAVQKARKIGFKIYIKG